MGSWLSIWWVKFTSLIARIMGPMWGLSGADRTQVGPMLAPWTLLSGMLCNPWDIALTFINYSSIWTRRVLQIEGLCRWFIDWGICGTRKLCILVDQMVSLDKYSHASQQREKYEEHFFVVLRKARLHNLEQPVSHSQAMMHWPNNNDSYVINHILCRG